MLYMYTVSCIRSGGVAQLGEHLPCKQGVIGSNPFTSTIDSYMWSYATGKQNVKHKQ